jgi:hypothetical protein
MHLSVYKNWKGHESNLIDILEFKFTDLNKVVEILAIKS